MMPKIPNKTPIPYNLDSQKDSFLVFEITTYSPMYNAMRILYEMPFMSSGTVCPNALTANEARSAIKNKQSGFPKEPNVKFFFLYFRVNQKNR
jgi:hypothetical protein